MRLTAATVGGLAILLGGVLSASAAPDRGGTVRPLSTFASTTRQPEYVPGELLVRFKPSVGRAALASVVGDERAALKETLLLPGLVLVRLPAGEPVAEAAKRFERHEGVLYAQPNRLLELSATPNDPRFAELWGLSQASDRDIDAPQAWDATTGSSSVIVGVIDSGVAYDNLDLAPNMWVNDDPPGGGDNDGNGFIDDTNGWDFWENDNVPKDENGHGTHVAGTIGARGNNAIGVAGVNWLVSIMALRSGGPGTSLSTAAITQSVTYACANGADVVNGSFGSSTLDLPIRDAVTAPGCANTLFVFSAGNASLDLDFANTYPCELHLPPTSAPNVICVGATDQNDQIAAFSNHGTTAVHLAAPGVGILSAWPAQQAVAPLEDFETNLAGWTTSGTSAWARTTEQKHSGSFSVTDSPGGSYADNTNSSLTRAAPLNLSGRDGCDVEYWLRLATEFGFDFLWLESSVDGVSWTPMGDEPLTGSTIGGNFFEFEDDLSNRDGQPVVYFRFRLDTDESVTLDGAHVDDVVFKCLQTGARTTTRSAGPR